MKIGIIGAGFIGAAAAGAFTRAGYEVMVSNTRGPRSLFTLVNTIGCKAGTIAEGAAFSDTVLVAIPLYTYDTLDAAMFVGKTVLDAGNYYAERDGSIPELDRHETTTSELLARHLPGANVVKALNAIAAGDIGRDGKPRGAPDRRALPIAGDVAAAKQTVATLLDTIGYDALDAGPLSEGWRFEKDTPVYCVPHTLEPLRAGLQAATHP